MALTQTTASAALGVNDLVLSVTSATGFAAGYEARIDNEFWVVGRDYVSGTNIPMTRRGDLGSQQVAHAILADVTVGATGDWPQGNVATYAQVPPNGWDTVTIGADATIVFPNKDTIYLIRKATAAAITLSAPATKGTVGVNARFFSETAAAHVITYTPGFYADTTSSDLATFAAKAGASATFQTYGGALIGVASLANVTLG